MSLKNLLFLMAASFLLNFHCSSILPMTKELERQSTGSVRLFTSYFFLKYPFLASFLFHCIMNKLFLSAAKDRMVCRQNPNIFIHNIDRCEKTLLGLTLGIAVTA